ncbi:Hsp70 family protein [Dactylosporangium cerinum]
MDIDAALISYLEATYRQRDPAAWDQLRHPDTPDTRRAWRQLTDDVRTAKEMLSRTAQTFVHIPLLSVDAPISREQVEAIGVPLITRTITATKAAITTAGLSLPPRGPVFLAGGASRMPLVATLLHRQFGTAPIATGQPELVVARGALLIQPDADPVAQPAAAASTHTGSDVSAPTAPAAASQPSVSTTQLTREATVIAAGGRRPSRQMISSPKLPARVRITAVLLTLFTFDGAAALDLVRPSTLFEIEPLYIAATVVMVGNLVWWAVLLGALLSRPPQPWVRIAVTVTALLWVPWFVFVVWMSRDYLVTPFSQGVEEDRWTFDLSLVLLTVIAIPLAALTPLMLISRDVTAYLRQRPTAG